MATRKTVKTTKKVTTRKARTPKVVISELTKPHPIDINMHLEKLDSGHITHIGNLGDLRQAVENSDNMITEFFSSFIEKFKNDVYSGQIVSISISCK